MFGIENAELATILGIVVTLIGGVMYLIKTSVNPLQKSIDEFNSSIKEFQADVRENRKLINDKIDHSFKENSDRLDKIHEDVALHENRIKVIETKLNERK